jgi:hypothetical protein
MKLFYQGNFTKPEEKHIRFYQWTGNVQGGWPSDTRAEREAGLKVGQIEIPLKNVPTSQSVLFPSRMGIVRAI